MVELRQSSSPARVRIRCAVYTRKSSEEGLEQEFNSLDAQREACEAYITSQKHEGWTVLEAGLVREIKAKTGMEAWRVPPARATSPITALAATFDDCDGSPIKWCGYGRSGCLGEIAKASSDWPASSSTPQRLAAATV